MAEKDNSLKKITILGGKCHLFQRSGSPFWWCGYHFQGKYIRTSTKEKSQGGAESFAHRWYFQQQTEIASGTIANPKLTFSKIATTALASYKGLVERGIRSQKTYDGIEGILLSRVMPYFKDKPVTSIDNAMWHAYKADILETYPLATRGTLHQYKNALRVVLNEAYRSGVLKEVSIFKDEYKSRKIESARPWFSEAEYSKLHQAIMAHARKLKKIDKRQHANALELHDYVIFGVNTGMRVGELNNVRFCDVQVKTEKLSGKEILIIGNIKGKRGTGTCQSYYGAVPAFKRLVERRGIDKPQASTEKLFLTHHRVMFNVILNKTDLKIAKTNPPSKRDFVSLRATYICFRLLNGVPVYEVANNCRTSVAMIEQSYAKYLGGSLMQNINKTSIDGWHR